MDLKRKASEQHSKEARDTSDEPELIVLPEDLPSVVTTSKKTPSSAKKQRFDEDAEGQHEDATAHDEADANPKSWDKIDYHDYVRWSPNQQRKLFTMDRKRKASEEHSKEAGVTSEEPELIVLPEDQPSVVTPCKKTPSSVKKQRFDEDAEVRHGTCVNLEKVGIFEKEEEATAQDEASVEEVDAKPESGDKMGFGKHAERTYREVMIDHHDYVHWGRSQESPTDGLARFLEWTNSDEGMALETEGQGNQKFTFGQHKGQKFREIAQEDPTYHERYMWVLMNKNEEPNPILERYIAYLKIVIGEQVFPSGQYHYRGESFRWDEEEDTSNNLCFPGF
jgi:hypothetical protein